MSDGQRRAAGDRDLARAIAEGDRLALAELYSRYGGPSFALARRVTSDRAIAKEVVQEVFLALWRQPDRFDPGRGSMRSYLYAHVHGRSVDRVRASSSGRAHEARDAFRGRSSAAGVERADARAGEAEAVPRALADLPHGERTAIELAYFGGRTYREAATLLGVPEGTVKSSIRAGLQRLRAALIEAGMTE